MPRRPPKEWFYYVVNELRQVPDVRNAEAVAGWLWYKFMKPETKRAILKAEGKLDPELKVRKGLIKKPKVTSYKDFKASGLMRVLWLDDPTHKLGEYRLFPEFALYPKRKPAILSSLQHAGFKEEEAGKWVLRTNKFSVFVYV